MSVMLVSSATLNLIANAQLGKTDPEKREIFLALRNANREAYRERYGLADWRPVIFEEAQPCQIVREYIPDATPDEIAAQIAFAAQCFEYQATDWSGYFASPAEDAVKRAMMFCPDMTKDKFPRIIWDMGGD